MKLKSLTARLAALLCACGFAFSVQADVGASLQLSGTTITPAAFKTAVAGEVTYNGQGVTVDFSEGASFDHSGDGPQFYVLGDSANPRTTDITISNVKFYAPQTTKAQLYLYATANVTFENCIFDNVSVSMNGTSHASKGTFTSCSFVNVRNYALKYVENVEVSNCMFDACDRAMMLSSKKDAKNLSYVADATAVSDIISIDHCSFRNITKDRIIKFYEILTDNDTVMSITDNTVESSCTAYFIIVDFDLAETPASNTYTILYTGNTGVAVNKLNEGDNTEKMLYIDGDYLVDVEPVAVTYVAQIGETKYETLAAAIDAGQAGDTVEVLVDEIDCAGWTPVNIDSNSKLVTLNGNGVVLKNLSAPLFNKTGSGCKGVVVKNVTVKGANISTSSYAAAFLPYADSTETAYFENCHVVDSTITSTETYAAGFVAYAAGYNNQNDGPVFTTVTIKDCSVKNSTITGANSTGGLMGHATGSAWTLVNVEGTEVAGNTIACTGSSNVKAGSLFGTVGAAGQESYGQTGGIVVGGDTVVKGNTMTSNGVASEQIFGRIGSSGGALAVTGGTYDGTANYANDTYDSTNGKIIISGGSFKTAPSADALADGYAVTGTPNDDGYYTLEDLPVIATVTAGGTTKNYYDLHEALEAGKASGTTITLLTDVDLSGVNWVSVGTSASPFTGVFDGNGKTISNLSVNDEALTYAGLLGFVTGSTLKNITISNVTVNAAASIGSLMGYCNTSSVTNCHVQGRIQLSGHYKMGGILGEGYTSFTDCSVIGDGESTSSILATPLMKTDDPTKYEYEADNIGGMVGHWSEGAATIKNCRVKDISVTGYRKIGGMAAISFCSQKIEDVTVENVKITCTAPKAYAEDNTSTTGMGGIVGQYHRQGGSYTGGWMKGATIKNVNLEATDSEALGIIKAGLVSSGLRDSAAAESPISKASMTFSDIVFEGENSIPDGVKTMNDAAFGPVYVAQIGETKYETLAAAINAAQSGDTVKLLADVTANAVVDITKSITLDGDGHELNTSANRAIWVSVGDVTVTIKNLTIPAKANLERAIQVNLYANNVTLTIDNVRATATAYTVNICNEVNNLELTIKDSNITGWSAVNLWGVNGSVTITNSTLTGVNDKGYDAAGWNNFGVIVVEGDTTGQTDVHATACEITVTDTTIKSLSTTGNKQFAILYNKPNVSNSITLDNCLVVLGNENCTFFRDKGTDNITKVRNTVDDATHELPILPFGYCYAAPDADGYRLITKAVAEVAGEYYATLAEAVAATDEGTINLIRDASGAGIFIGANAGKSITIDFGGYTYTVVGPAVGSKGTESQAFHLEKGNSVTLKNGNVTATTDSGVLMLVQNYCDLTLDDIVLDGSENSNISYVVSNNNGSMTATGSTCILAAEGKVAFDVCATSYYPEGVTVTFDSNFEGFVEGKVEYDVWGSIPANNKATLTIEEGNDGWFVIDWQVEEALAQAAKSNFNIAGGTFTTDVPADYCADGFIPTSFVDEDDGETYYAVRPANYVAQIGSTKYESLADAIAAVQDDDTIELLSDTTVAAGYAKSIGESGYGEGVGANRLVISTDKTFTVDLGGHVLMGRINFARGNMTLVNGTVRASSQALNIFGSKDYAYAGREYSVITVGADVTVEANYALCIFAGDPNNTYYPIGFGEVFNVYGKIKANSPVYVSGNVGMDTYVANCGTLADVEALKESTSKGVSELMSLYGPTINIYDGAELIANPSSAASDSSQGVSLSGCAIVNVFGGKITGAEGVGIKGGILNVSGGTITGTGAKCDPVQAVSSGTESSGAAISASTNYNANYPIEINVTGGIIKSVNNAALLVAHSVKSGTPVKAVNGIGASISGGSFIGGATEEAVIIESALEGEDDLYPEKFISGGYFSTKVPDGYCADGLVPTTKPTANGLYTVVEPATVTFAKGDTSLEVLLPDSFTYPSGDLAEIALKNPTYTATDTTFAGWKIGGAGDAIAALPAGTKDNVTLVATWETVRTISVDTSATPEQTVLNNIKVTESWIESNANLTSESSNEAIKEELEKPASNGLKVWENYVLGQDPTTKVEVESEQGVSETAMPVKNTLAVQPVDTGFKVKYSLDKVSSSQSSATVEQKGQEQDTSDLELNLKEATSGGSNVAYYKMTATIQKMTGETVSTVHSENTIGVLAVKEAPATAIIGVPWSSSTDNTSISVNDLVRTANLTPGDELKVYDPKTKTYKMWTLDDDKEWEPVETSSGSGTSNPGEAQDNTVARGAGVWLTRKNPDEPIYLVGQATAEAAATPLETPESSDDPTWNLVASPSVEPVDLAVLLEGTTTDSVMVPTESAPKNFIKIGDKWGYVSYETVNGRARPSFKTDDTKVSAGTGFWYLNGDSTKTDKKLNW